MSKRAMIFATVLMVLALPAGAHSVEEIEQWEENWNDRLRAASHEDRTTGLTTQTVGPLMLERSQWEARHEWYYNSTGDLRGSGVSPSSTSSNSSGTDGVVQGTGHGEGAGVEQWRPLVQAYFPGDQVEKALAVMACESGGNPNADNPVSSAAGLFQFLKSTWDNMVPLSVTGGSYSSGQVYDPEANVRSAAWLLAAAGWSQWSCA